MSDHESLLQRTNNAFDTWLTGCTVKGNLSRNAIAVGIVILDKLLIHGILTDDKVFSIGGEVKGVRSGLGPILTKYGIPADYLKEATNRQNSQYARNLLEALDRGTLLAGFDVQQRNEILNGFLDRLKKRAMDWLARRGLSPYFDRTGAPSEWIVAILQEAKGRSAGIVEQHLVGAKLAFRLPDKVIPNHPAHSGDAQTSRDGDFSLDKVAYHVTAAPGPKVISRCTANLAKGLHPILIVPRHLQANVLFLIDQDPSTKKRISVLAIEDFVANNIIELAIEADSSLYEVFEKIIGIYNSRLSEVETDVSLRIELP